MARHWIDGQCGRLNGVSALDDFLEYRTIIHEVDLRAKSRSAGGAAA
jgi:hypothetical protein